MNPTMLQSAILKGIRDLLSHLGQPDPGLDGAHYVLEADITSAPPLSVHKSRLVPSTQFVTLMPALEGGPDWIHANLYRSSDHTPIIGLARGQLCGNPNPTLNFSVDTQELHISD